MKKFTTMLANLLGIKDVPQKDGKLELSQEQENSLSEQLTEAEKATLIEQVTSELSDITDVKTKLSIATAEAAKAKENEAKAKEENEDANTEITALTAKVNELTSTVNKLSKEPEGEGAVAEVVKSAVAKATGKILDIAGQLIGYEGKLWETNRPWNARALSGAPATKFSDQVVIDQLNSDLIGFQADYPTSFDDLFDQAFDLPEAWKKNTIFGVSDRLVSATIEVDEVTQGRKMYWNPKGGATIRAEVMQVRPTQIDLQFNYAEMQRIETQWIHQFNREGTQAYKQTFIQFLLGKYIEKARKEDADVKVRGVWVELPDDGQKRVAPSYLFRHDGILKIIFDAKNEGKYRPFNLGKLTDANIFDKVHEAIDLLPVDVRTSQLEMALSEYWIRAYKLRDEQLRGQNNNYTGYPATPRDYSNISFVPVRQFEGTDLMFITFPGNVKPLEFKPQEKSMFTMERFLRDTYIFADYRDGIGINHIGIKTEANDPLKYYKQAIWTNDVPLFNSNFYAVAYDDKNGILKVRHNRVQPENAFTTDITNIEGSVGSYLIIRGDVTMGTAVKVKKNSNLKLVSTDFSLKSGGTLTLIKDTPTTWKEVSRTAAPEVGDSVKEFDTATITYEGATEYKYDGAAAATLAEIVGGTEGNTIRIYGSVNAFTVSSVSGKVAVDSNAVLDSDVKFIDLIFVNGLWNELARG